MSEGIYKQLSNHLSLLGMGYPVTDDLGEILKENFSALEAEVALALPTKVTPLELATVGDIVDKVSVSREALENILEKLAQRGLLFTGKTKDGEKGYALQQVGYGFPQSFFWKGEDTPHARNMANLIARYLNRSVTREMYGDTETKASRYIPVGGTIAHDMQAVYPYDLMERVIDKARVIAVCHCPCRMIARFKGKGCDHPLEVCLKYDEIAEYVIEQGLGREITKGEALRIIKMAEEAGLVHFVDNSIEDIKHTCNCCGCACWSVGSIRRRKIPRDVIMATYYLRYTDLEQCTGCGDCVEICPVDAVTVEGDHSSVDREWCIGCGICVAHCPTSAAKLEPRTGRVPSPDFNELHKRILIEKGLK